MLRSRIFLPLDRRTNDGTINISNTDTEGEKNYVLETKKHFNNSSSSRIIIIMRRYFYDPRLVWFLLVLIILLLFIMGSMLMVSPWTTTTSTRCTTSADVSSTTNPTWIRTQRPQPEKQPAEVRKAEEEEEEIISGSSSPRREERQYHVVFSTDCSKYQQWQSFAVFYSAWNVGQPGTVTRIVSGCTEEQQSWVREWHTKYVTPLSSHFKIHFTPHFSSIQDDNGHPLPGKKYEFFNKPLGLLHYLDRYYTKTSIRDPTNAHKNNTDTNTQQLQLYSQDILIVLDPDQILLRPITHDFTPSSTYLPTFGQTTVSNTTTVVEDGKPFGQRYDLGWRWVDFNLTRITSSTTSPSLRVSRPDAEEFYAVGPPYIATVSDFHTITQKWVEFVPLVHKEYPLLLAEMFAYCIAASHLQLPHVIIDSLMVSDQRVSKGEGWDFLQHVPPEDICTFAADTVTQFSTTKKKNKGRSWSSAQDMVLAQIPNVLHLCQQYMVGEWFFFKRHMPTDYFSCESPILQTPPSNLGAMYNYHIRPGDPQHQHIPLPALQIQKSTFMICAATKALQDASHYFKSQYCPNRKEVLNLFEFFYK